ncbi:MAG TPA: tryptophan--tRNA ligase [Candidatus Limnocylindrales bacterium]|nr:tryptophan--tRNA ligase [Candidatus Limnocylindrales bacterium]
MNGQPDSTQAAVAPAVVVSGTRPTGALHLGHLNGALKNWVALQQRSRCFFFVADWHALTTDYADPKNIRHSTGEMVLDWLAVGLDPQRCVIFRQSHVREHAELHLLFSMIIPVPWLERVPTYKEQQQQLEGRDLSTYGFLGYPLLQSADILLYKADAVPVGEDQLPHIELTREVARRFNHLYGNVFPEPAGMVVQAARVPGTDGRKMSKSYGNAVSLGDDADTVYNKLVRMMTDPRRVRRTDAGDPKDCPAFRLHEIYCTEEEKAELTVGCRTASIGCVDCKKVMIKHVIAELTPIQERRRRFGEKPGTAEDVLADGCARATQVAKETMAQVREAMGL